MAHRGFGEPGGVRRLSEHQFHRGVFFDVGLRESREALIHCFFVVGRGGEFRHLGDHGGRIVGFGKCLL